MLQLRASITRRKRKFQEKKIVTSLHLFSQMSRLDIVYQHVNEALDSDPGNIPDGLDCLGGPQLGSMGTFCAISNMVDKVYLSSNLFRVSRIRTYSSFGPQQCTYLRCTSLKPSSVQRLPWRRLINAVACWKSLQWQLREECHDRRSMQ
jgi:hypothetical protein